MKLEKGYANQLDQYVDQIFNTGMTTIPIWWLYAAFDAERLSKSVWKAIAEHCADRFDESEENILKHLKVIRPRMSDSALFIYADDHCPIEPIGSLSGKA
ncbi:hypothetical protein [Pseudooctadecabacter sp.]|uniref:hypothetical protein n=1 Tax=Pseudooctadecabacter sp. TaxID=1966338 RepID=UPI0035C87DB3